MRFRATETKGLQPIYTQYSDIHRWTPGFLKRLHATGPRFIAPLRKRERDMVIDYAEREGLVARVPVIGGHVIVPMIEDYEKWVAEGKPPIRKRKPKEKTALQLLARGTAVERLVDKEGLFLIKHFDQYVSRLEELEGEPVFLVVKRDGYTPRSLKNVLNEKCGEIRFGPGRVIIYDPDPKRAARGVPPLFEDYTEIRDLHDLLPASLLGPV